MKFLETNTGKKMLEEVFTMRDNLLWTAQREAGQAAKSPSGCYITYFQPANLNHTRTSVMHNGSVNSNDSRHHYLVGGYTKLPHIARQSGRIGLLEGRNGRFVLQTYYNMSRSIRPLCGRVLPSMSNIPPWKPIQRSNFSCLYRFILAGS